MTDPVYEIWTYNLPVAQIKPHGYTTQIYHPSITFYYIKTNYCISLSTEEAVQSLKEDQIWSLTKEQSSSAGVRLISSGEVMDERVVRGVRGEGRVSQVL